MIMAVPQLKTLYNQIKECEFVPATLSDTRLQFTAQKKRQNCLGTGQWSSWNGKFLNKIYNACVYVKIFQIASIFSKTQ